MGLEEEFNQKLQLPKPSTIPKFETITNTDETSSIRSSSLSEKSYRIKSRNPHLYLQSDSSHDKFYEYEGPNEHDITASIIEAHGGKTPTNQDEVEIWRVKSEESRLKQLAEKKRLMKEAEEKRLKGETEEQTTEQEDENTKDVESIKSTGSSEISSKSEKTTKFKRNVCMRSLEQSLELGEIPGSFIKPTSSGKNDINNHENIPMLTQSIDDPDFYYLRDTSSSNFNEVDDFRFRHRGVKKTVTPRHYALHELSDECFKFRRD